MQRPCQKRGLSALLGVPRLAGQRLEVAGFPPLPWAVLQEKVQVTVLRLDAFVQLHRRIHHGRMHAATPPLLCPQPALHLHSTDQASQCTWWTIYKVYKDFVNLQMVQNFRSPDAG